MKRLLISLALFVTAAAVAVAAPFVGTWLSDGSSAGDETTITDYTADFTVDAQGRLSAVERITVLFPEWVSKRGIFRFFDTFDDNDQAARRQPYDLSVTRDGKQEPFTRSEQGHGRYDVLRIGNPDVVLDPGVHVYVIRYRIDDALIPVKVPGQSGFYWNLVPGGWQQHIDQTRLTVHLPAVATQARCAVGWGATGGCTVEGDGSNDLTISTQALAPLTPVTLQTLVDQPVPPRSAPKHYWPGRFDAVFGSSPIALIPVVLLVLAALLIGWRRGSQATETEPGHPLMYAPPERLGPAQAHYVVAEQPSKHGLVATLMYAAERGAISLEAAPDGARTSWTVTSSLNREAWADLDPVTIEVLASLGVSVAGGSFQASSASTDSGRRLGDAMANLSSSLGRWGRADNLLEPSGVTGLPLIAAAALMAYLLWSNPLNASISALVPGAFIAGAWPVLLPGGMTRRTPAGRDLWARAGGFARILSTPSAQDRFDFSGRQGAYTAYLPYAVAFGVAAQWAAKYRAEVGQEPPMPAYWGGVYAGGNNGVYVDKLVNDFSQTVDSAISSYQESIAPSSGGSGGGFSGGFSGGGGGGGGGGGSW